MISQTDGEIIELITSYIEDVNSKYAILIDGEWGCGKTYFVKEHLIHKINEIRLPTSKIKISKKSHKYKSIYLSLYGIKSTSEISSQLYVSILSSPFKDKTNNPFIKVLKSAQPLVGAGLRIVSDKLNVAPILSIDIKKVMEPFSSLDKYVFIFDDLERCSIDVNEILGYINYLVEQNNVKAIIVANESEIGQLKFCDSLEQKYLVAAMDREFDNKSKQPNTPTNGFITTKTAPTTLQQRAEDIFCSDEQYQKLKEKLIGKVVYYQPDLKQVLPHIVSMRMNVAEEKEFVLAYIDQIIDLLSLMHCHNLRTIEFALSCFSHIYKVNVKHIISIEYEQEIWSDILFSCFFESVRYKAGKEGDNWSTGLYGRRRIAEEQLIGPAIDSFRFVEEYVRYSSFNAENIQDVIKLYLVECMSSHAKKDDTLDSLSNYWKQEDDTNETLLQNLNKKIEDDYYPVGSFSRILSLLFNLKHVGYNVDIEHFISRMSDSIEKHGGDIGDRAAFFSPDQNTDEYRKKVADLRKLCDKAQENSHSNQINTILSLGQNWGAMLSDYVSKNRMTFIEQKYFWAYVNPEICTSALEKCTVADFSSFRQCFSTVYDFSNLYEYFKADSQNLHLLKDYIDAATYSSKMKKMHRNYFIVSLNEIIKNIDKEQ